MAEARDAEEEGDARLKSPKLGVSQGELGRQEREWQAGLEVKDQGKGGVNGRGRGS